MARATSRSSVNDKIMADTVREDFVAAADVTCLVGGITADKREEEEEDDDGDSEEGNRDDWQ